MLLIVEEKKSHIRSFHAAHWGLSMFSFSHLSIHGIQFGARAWRALLLPLGVVAIDVGHMLLWPLASSPIFYLFTPQLWPHWFQIALLLWWLISDACSDSDWSTAWERLKASVGWLNGPAKCVLCLFCQWWERVVNYASDSVWLKLDQSSSSDCILNLLMCDIRIRWIRFATESFPFRSLTSSYDLNHQHSQKTKKKANTAWWYLDILYAKCSRNKTFHLVSL